MEWATGLRCRRDDGDVDDGVVMVIVWSEHACVRFGSGGGVR